MIKTINICGKDTKIVVGKTKSLGIMPSFHSENTGFCNAYYIVHFPANYVVGKFLLRDTAVKALRALEKLNWNFSSLKDMPRRTHVLSGMVTRELNNAEAEILSAFFTIEKYFGVSADTLINLTQNHGRTTKTTRANSYSQKPAKPER